MDVCFLDSGTSFSLAFPPQLLTPQVLIARASVAPFGPTYFLQALFTLVQLTTPGNCCCILCVPGHRAQDCPSLKKVPAVPSGPCHLTSLWSGGRAVVGDLSVNNWVVQWTERAQTIGRKVYKKQWGNPDWMETSPPCPPSPKCLTHSVCFPKCSFSCICSPVGAGGFEPRVKIMTFHIKGKWKEMPGWVVAWSTWFYVFEIITDKMPCILFFSFFMRLHL